MGRAIAGVVLGYVAMFVVLFVFFSAAYIGMGQELAFKPGRYEPSGLWVGLSFVLGLLAAIVGGFVCVLISRREKIGRVLAGVVFVLGLLFAVPVVLASSEPSAERTGEVGNMDAMTKAKQPAFVALLNPFVGAVGVLIGARLRRPR
jgi:hypothetical protein